MTAYLKDQGLILGKMQRGEPLTQGEQMKLLSRGVDYSKGSPAVVDFSDGSSVADKVPDVGVMESGPSKGRGVGSTVASMGGSIASAAGVKAPLGAITGLASGVLDNQPLAQTVVNTAWGGVKDLTGMMGPVGQLGMAAYGLFSSEDPTAAAVNLGLSTIGTGVGTALAGPWGGVVGNVAGHYAGDKVNASLRDGIIGDALGTRTFEGYRDSLEEMGLVEREIAEAVNEMSREQERGRHQAAQNPSSRSNPDRDKFGLGYSFGGNVTDSQGNHASVGVTEGSPFGGASVSNPGSIESGMLGDMAAGMFGGGSGSDSGGKAGGNAGGVRGGGSEGNSGYW